MEGEGYFLHAHVGVVEEVLGLEQYAARYPFGGAVAGGVADDGAEVFGREVHPLGVEGDAPLRAVVLSDELDETAEHLLLVVVDGVAAAFVLLLQVLYEAGDDGIAQGADAVAYDLVVVGKLLGLADSLGHHAYLPPEEVEGFRAELQGVELVERADVGQQVLQGEVDLVQEGFAEQDDGGLAFVEVRDLHDDAGLGIDDGAGEDGGLLEVAGDGELTFPAEEYGKAVEPRGVAEESLAFFHVFFL